MIGPPALIAAGTLSCPSGARAWASLPMLELTRPETVRTVSTIRTRTPVIVQMPHRRFGAVDRVRLFVTMRHPLPPHRDTTVS